MLSMFIAGFITQASLIMAIGAQNSFVLRQGLLGKYIGSVVWFCIISDFLLAALAVYGVGSVVTLDTKLAFVMQVLAIMFLLAYAALSFKRALQKAEPIHENR